MSRERKFTRDNPASDPAPRAPRKLARPVETETGWYLPPVEPDRGTPPWEFIPTRAYFASYPDVTEVTWVAPVVCTGRNTHKVTRLGSAYRLIREDGTTDAFLMSPTSYELRRWRDRSLPLYPPGGDVGTLHVIMPDADREPGKGDRQAVRITCPRCSLDLRVNGAKLRRGLAALNELAELDVSKLV